MASKSTTAENARPVSEPGTLVLLCLAAWAIPGAGHFWLGRTQKGTVFLVALTTMFVTGLLLNGRLFPFDFSDPLVALAALANGGLGLPWDPQCLDFHQTERVVITASKWQVRQPINARSVGRWRNYEKYLAPLRHLS